MICNLCQTDEAVEEHHVLPKSKGGRHKETVSCCSDCGGQVHMLFTNTQLAMMTLEELASEERMGKYLKWKKKHPGPHRHRLSKDVKEWKKYHR